MDDELRDKMMAERAVTDWRSLRPHEERGVLWMIGPGADLLDVALAVARDETDAVAALLVAGEMARPVPDQVARWEEQPDTTFGFLIVQPFVLAVELTG